MIQREAVAGLLLDEENPRYAEHAESQEHALTLMLELAGPKVLNLAKDIVEQDAVNPTELPIAFEQDHKLIVVEGNRRLAALKLLKDPSLGQDASDRTGEDYVGKFRRLQKQGAGPSDIDVYIAESRNAARHWIELRHTGERDGVGVLAWEAWQTNNYRRRRGSHADRATMFCRAVEADHSGDADLLALVAMVRKNKLTTLGRIVSDPSVRQDFGFDFVGDEVVFSYPSDAMRPGIMRIFQDLAGNLTVTEVKTKEQREAFITGRASSLPPRERKMLSPRRPGERDAAELSQNKEEREQTGQEEQKLPGKNPREPRLENVIFKGMRLPNTSSRIRELLAQAQRINIDDAPQIAAVLVRIIVELVVSQAIVEQVVKGREADVLKTKIRNALLALDPNCEQPKKRNKALEMAWQRTQDPDGMAVQSLHAFVHNPHSSAAALPSEVRAYSRMFRPMLESLDTLIASKRS